jgi:Flp pilus assembly protein TadG
MEAKTMRKLSHFATERSGTVAIAFSVAAIPAMMLVGAAIDFTRTISYRPNLQAVVDSAALAAGLDLSGATDSQLQAKADTAIRGALGANRNVIVDSVSLATSQGNIVLTVRSHTDTNFGRFWGQSSLRATTVAAVPKRVGQKLDVEFLLDASASMGLAATPAGRDRLYAATGCAFACHLPEGGQTISNLQTARNLGILTRLDVLQNSVGTMIGRLAATKGPLDTFRVAIDTFDDTPHQAVPITGDLTSARTYVQNLQLLNNTSFSNAMPQFNVDVGTQGDGASTPKKIAIIVTDGVQGRRDRVGGFHPFNASLCDTLKNRNVTVMVLNTKYIPMPLEAAYRDTVQPIQNQLEPALQACASTGYYFSATDQADIENAFGQMFNAIQARLRLVM